MKQYNLGYSRVSAHLGRTGKLANTYQEKHDGQKLEENHGQVIIHYIGRNLTHLASIIPLFYTDKPDQ